LADLGYRVHLIDAVALHVARAAESSRGRFTAAVGDARDLPLEGSSWDAVLMLGPLYHLTDREERIHPLKEGQRVLKPGGALAAAAISWFVSLLDGLVNGWLGDPSFDATRRARTLAARAPGRPRAGSRAELLHVLMLPDLDRAERIGEFWGYPETRTFGELLIDLEEDKAARAVVWGLLMEQGARTVLLSSTFE
jgi:SAM-dependent methyltransferase